MRVAGSTLVALRLIARVRPDVVIGFGGYVSIPVGLAAWLLRVPLVVHEQNAVPGLANRLLARLAVACALTYESSRALLGPCERCLVTGNPVRAAVLRATRGEGRLHLALPDDATVLLVFGGSRGAKHLNAAMLALRERLLAHPDLVVVHVTGPCEYDSVRSALVGHDGDAERWRVVPYLDEMPAALAAADVVVARAGATSIAEITARGLPCVLVPYPYATDDHQTANARALADRGGAIVVPDDELDTPKFGDSLERLIGDVDLRATMAAASQELGVVDAAQRLARVARDAASRR